MHKKTSQLIISREGQVQTATITGLYRSRKVKTAYDVLFVSFSCHRTVLT